MTKKVARKPNSSRIKSERPLPVMTPEARAHFFGDVERDGHGDEGPEQRVALMGAGLCVGGDAAGVVVDVGGDQAGADDREEQSEALAQGADALLQVRASVAGGGEAVEMERQSICGAEISSLSCCVCLRFLV